MFLLLYMQVGTLVVNYVHILILFNSRAIYSFVLLAFSNGNVVAQGGLDHPIMVEVVDIKIMYVLYGLLSILKGKTCFVYMIKIQAFRGLLLAKAYIINTCILTFIQYLVIDLND